MKITEIISLLTVSALACVSSLAHAEEIGEVNTAFHITGSDKIVVEAINDEDIKGVSCHLSYAKTGGLKGTFGFAEDPSRFSIACRQTGPLVAIKPIPKQTEIASFKRSIIFKQMNVVRMYDTKNNVLVYLVYATKILDGSPFNSISSVPLMPWGTVMPQVTVK